MSGTLFVVATPIGNLEDITLRALRVLREADLIAAEDTRRTSRLLAHYSVTTPALSFHQHNARQRLPQLLRRLHDGDDVAMVTDAGMPAVSDPGLELIQACLGNDVKVETIPGASAPLTAAVASGFPLDPLTIFGFPPTRSHARTAWFSNAMAVQHTFTFFEAPHRILRTLRDMAEYSGERPICVARELTKVHEQFLRGTTATVIGQITDPRGEFTVVVGPASTDEVSEHLISERQLFDEFCRLTESGDVRRRQAVVQLARKHGKSARDVYTVIQRHRDMGE